jgi:hypothetical protein
MPLANFDYSPAIAMNSRPVTSKAPPQTSHNARGVFTERVNKRAYHMQSSINCGYLRFHKIGEGAPTGPNITNY